MIANINNDFFLNVFLTLNMARFMVTLVIQYPYSGPTTSHTFSTLESSEDKALQVIVGHQWWSGCRG